MKKSRFCELQDRQIKNIVVLLKICYQTFREIVKHVMVFKILERIRLSLYVLLRESNPHPTCVML